jgi:isopentenyldiphosphate isomerase
MEYLDVYNENHEMIGTYPRDEVHEKGMWHNTIHCWLYDNDGNAYFQVRSDSNKLYTTASGHVQAGETLKEAFGREVSEEIGIDVLYEKAELLNVVTWKMDKEKNGKLIKDRAFANVYLLKLDNTNLKFDFSNHEVCGLAIINANETLEMFEEKISSVNGTFINNKNEKVERDFINEDFLLMPGETLIQKYGDILNAIKGK